MLAPTHNVTASNSINVTLPKTECCAVPIVIGIPPPTSHSSTVPIFLASFQNISLLPILFFFFPMYYFQSTCLPAERRKKITMPENKNNWVPSAEGFWSVAVVIPSLESNRIVFRMQWFWPVSGCVSRNQRLRDCGSSGVLENLMFSFGNLFASLIFHYSIVNCILLNLTIDVTTVLF